ncbi:XdhC family protein [Chloroflexota bacterium]
MSIYQTLAELDDCNDTGTLCTIVRCRDSTPRCTGGKILVFLDGKTMGLVGGGELENRVIYEARKAIVDGQSRPDRQYDLKYTHS